MTELLVIRHGETDYNRQQRFQGQIDVPLNALGRLQAQRLAERMLREEIDALWSSDLERARATAEAVALALGIESRVEPLWREQSFGVLEGLDLPTIQREHAPLWTQWTRHDPDFALPGGESVRAFHARVMRALEALADAHRGQRVAVVTHGGVLDMLWRTAKEASLHGPRTADIPNTGVNVLRWRDGVLAVLAWGDAAHLEGLPQQPSTAQRSDATSR